MWPPAASHLEVVVPPLARLAAAGADFGPHAPSCARGSAGTGRAQHSPQPVTVQHSAAQRSIAQRSTAKVG